MLPKEYKIRNMIREELDIAVEWAAKEGWNPGLHDADVFWNTDPEGYIALEKDGEMIGSGSIVSYGGRFGFMGFFIVKPEHRGQGLGTELWYYRRDKLLDKLGNGAVIGMDGVFDMQGFYTKGGFKFSHKNLRMEGTIPTQKFDTTRITRIVTQDFEMVNRFDKEHFGFDRTAFLKGWLNLKDSIGYKALTDDEIVGYGVIRKCRNGYKIGPLFAEDYDTAEEVFKALIQSADGDNVFLDIPEINKNAVKLAEKYSFKECFGCARMYHGEAPKLPYDQVYGVTTFELG